MKTIYFQSQEGNRFVVRNTIDDALDLKRFPHKRIINFALFFGKRTEREGRAIAKDMVDRMLKLMAYDLVEHNDAFVLPKQDTGLLKIADLKGRSDMERYRLDPIDEEDTRYGGILNFKNIFYRAIGGKRYFFKLTQPWVNRIRELQAIGMRWR